MPVILLIPMSASIGEDIDHLSDDAKELVRRGKLKLDDIAIKHRLPKKKP